MEGLILLRSRPTLLKATFPLLRTCYYQRPVPAALISSAAYTSAAPTAVPAVPLPTHAREHVVTSPLPPVTLPTGDLPTLLYQRLEKYRHLDAIECVVTGRKYTFGEVLDLGLRWGGIVNSVLPPPSPSSPPAPRSVALLSKNNPEFPIILLGTLAAGASVATINCNYTAEEVARQLAGSEAGMLVTDPQLEGVAIEALAKLGKNLPVFVNGASSGGHASIPELLNDPNRPYCDLVESPPESMAVMLFSSGTTGPPKGVVLPHRAFTSNLAMFTHPGILGFQLPAEGEEQDTVTGLMPFYHIYGLYVVTLISMHQAAKVMSFPAFDSATFTRVIREQRVRVIHLVPPTLNFLTMSNQVTSNDLASVRVAMCAAAPVPPTVAKLFKDKAPNPVIFQEGFGMTEALGTHMTPLNEERLGFCGKVVPNTEAKVVNEDGEALPEGHRGELCIRSPSLMTGYYKNPQATAETLDAEGWLHTGDVAVHEDGFFSIVDRIKELIKVKGFQVSPSELEDTLLQHKGVTDVAVVGVPDDRAGELPRAYIVKSSESCSAEDIHGFLRDKLADFKQLHGGIRFVDSLPKNPTGKILRRELKEMAAEDIDP
ncbi:uncharacterized protein LOC126985721 [Eriocheir sinensis]|uniref:uncharacterized protein LOC126985721 n=1 Tax=Eriocheir sinensis TaxID=95602 RepID=UPI0021C87120|nr:uncharacterized protein LOC126985721 [Eriocheir sinensis]XP_050696859.1 uncharacterized protein LOC126985721 [Eriocheir sinensis]XP_050696860.1 uncharacterized protein LOC126985721 [Eriocheir sinensis]XP_050696861.1 uncharacterized protein LOC126985721 [Eriocheir sinensis]XP_050696862.1 uncharacterized protein LOC126985721 [Eriocheir sinensis]XP_050696863.1 uncharacterized protein LOC126985721 [Eriocheir sinensis]XP_050696864.1 uncharacterized protein LOC126985721 [Eriocheir sinensis]XP_0